MIAAGKFYFGTVKCIIKYFFFYYSIVIMICENIKEASNEYKIISPGVARIYKEYKIAKGASYKIVIHGYKKCNSHVKLFIIGSDNKYRLLSNKYQLRNKLMKLEYDYINRTGIDDIIKVGFFCRLGVTSDSFCLERFDVWSGEDKVYEVGKIREVRMECNDGVVEEDVEDVEDVDDVEDVEDVEDVVPTLPTELIQSVLSYMSRKDLLAAYNVCRLWRVLVEELVRSSHSMYITIPLRKTNPGEHITPYTAHHVVPVSNGPSHIKGIRFVLHDTDGLYWRVDLDLFVAAEVAVTVDLTITHMLRMQRCQDWRGCPPITPNVVRMISTSK